MKERFKKHLTNEYERKLRHDGDAGRGKTAADTDANVDAGVVPDVHGKVDVGVVCRQWCTEGNEKECDDMCLIQGVSSLRLQMASSRDGSARRRAISSLPRPANLFGA